MGIWGYKIFENDIALDIKERFEILLNSLDCVEATRKIISENQDVISDVDDVADFWFALAHIQCTKGILLDNVKEETLKCIENGSGVKKWESTPHYKKRQAVVDEIKKTILTYKPTNKKSRVKKPFICDWKIGDTFAYKLTSDYAKEKGLSNRYFIFHKESENSRFPSDIYPVVFVKITKDDKIPTSKDEIDSLDFVQISVVAEWMRGRTDDIKPYLEFQKYIAANSTSIYERDDHGYIPNYRISFSFTSKRNIPKEMIYLGNFHLRSPQQHVYKEEVQTILWKYAEKIIIDRYVAFNLRNSPLYNSK